MLTLSDAIAAYAERVGGLAGPPLARPHRDPSGPMGNVESSPWAGAVDPPKAGRQSLIQLLKRELRGIFPNFSGFKLASFLAVLGLFWP